MISGKKDRSLPYQIQKVRERYLLLTSIFLEIVVSQVSQEKESKYKYWDLDTVAAWRCAVWIALRREHVVQLLELQLTNNLQLLATSDLPQLPRQPQAND